MLAGILFKGILACGQTVDLIVHFLDFPLIPFHLLFLLTDLDTRLDPTDKVVLVEESDQQKEHGRGKNRIADERPLFGLFSILFSVPYVPELSQFAEES